MGEEDERDVLDGCMLSTPAASIVNDDDEIPSSQLATQPFHVSSEESDDSSDESETYGMLYPLLTTLRPVELNKPTFKVGRSSECDQVITLDQVVEDLLHHISKNHFQVVRSTDGTVELCNLGTNGTHVGDYWIRKKGEKKKLEHGDIIKLVETDCYVYMSTHKRYYKERPVELIDYAVSKKLGSGACGTVYRAFHLATGKPYAIKCLNKRNLESKGCRVPPRQEADLMTKVNHPCIIKLKELVETSDNLFIVMEYAHGGELFDKIIDTQKGFSERDAKIYFRQMVLAVEHMHSHKIAHRDLKPENMLIVKTNLDHFVVKITDLGLSKEADADTALRSFVGTTQYLAPEVLIAHARKCSYDLKVDMWSLGVILFVLLSARSPFSPTRKDKEIIKQIIDVDFSMQGEPWDNVSDECKDLIKKLLCKSSARLTATQALGHPWLANDNQVTEIVQKLLDTQHHDPSPPPTPLVAQPNQPVNHQGKRAHSTDEELEITNENQASNALRPCKRQK